MTCVDVDLTERLRCLIFAIYGKEDGLVSADIQLLVENGKNLDEPYTSRSRTRGTRGGAAKHPQDNRTFALKWMWKPYVLYARPMPTEHLVRQVFPPLARSTHVEDYPSFDRNKLTVAKVSGIPPLSRTRDPDLPLKLETAQEVFTRKSIPTKYWAFYLASKMTAESATVSLLRSKLG